MIVLSWQVRGSNHLEKLKEVSNFLVEHKVSVFGLLEHKVKEKNVSKVQRKLGNKWSWATNQIGAMKS